MVFVCSRCGNLSDSTRALNAHNRLCESVDTDRVDPINQTGLHSSTSIHENHFLKGMARFWDAFASSATVPEAEHSSHHDNNSSQFNIDNPAPISPDPRDDLNLPISNDSQDHQLSSENNIYQNKMSTLHLMNLLSKVVSATFCINHHRYKFFRFPQSTNRIYPWIWEWKEFIWAWKSETKVLFTRQPTLV